MILLQKIETTWTKASRGFPESQKRSEIPDLILRDLSTTYPDDSVVLQSFCMDESQAFEPDYVERVLNPKQVREEQLELIEIQNEIEVRYWGRDSKFGKAKRVGRIGPNQWLGLLANQRFPRYDTTLYKKWVYNICFARQTSLRDVLRMPASFCLDLQIDLW